MMLLSTGMIALFLLYAGLIGYYRKGWLQLPGFDSTDSKKKPGTTISVIIPARNEAANLPALLDSLHKQHYPAELFEVLLIDDHSTDDTANIMAAFPVSNIRRVSLAEHMHGEVVNSYKKKAIETGIKLSNGKLIVTTDADCRMHAKWLASLAACYEQSRPKFIAAPVCIQNGNRFIEIFQSLDFMTLQGITGASVFKKLHSMCNGANMAYEREAFNEVGGYKGIDSIASGDDMLLMHKIFTRYPGEVMFLKSKEAIVYTSPVHSVKEFFNQRIRWASKAGKYDDKRITLVLMLVYLFNVMFLVVPLVSALGHDKIILPGFTCSMLTLWGLLLVAKTAVELIFLYPVAAFFGKTQLLWLFPVAQPFHIIYTVIAGWLGVFGSYQWKERKVK